jgi:hypothetical protein
MDGGEFGVIVPSPPSSVPAVLAVKGIAPETALAACGGAWVLARAMSVVPPAGALLTAGGKIACIASVDR